jgi:hypothetical protein
MAVIYPVTEDWSQAAVEEEAGRIAATRVFTVLFDGGDAPESRVLLARNAGGIPTPWARHPYHRWLYVSSKRVRPLGPFLFEVTVNYEAITEGRTGAYDEPVSPLALPPEINWGFAVHSEMIDRDIDDVAISNSAGQTFDPPIQEDKYDLVMSVQWNRPSFNRLLAAEYIGQINSDVFYGFPIGTVRCVNLAGVEIFTPYLIYYRVSMEFHIRWAGWKRRILDQGWAIKTGVDGDGKPIYKVNKDEDDTILPEPVKFDGAGGILPFASDGYFLEFDTLVALPFAVFGLG